MRPRDPEQEIWDGCRAGVEGAKSEYSADEAFPIAEFDEKLQEILDGAGSALLRVWPHLGGDRSEDHSPDCRDARDQSQAIHPPRTIIDPATIVHEMRVLKSEDEIELMQRAADIAAEAHVEAMKSVRPGMKEYEVEALIEAVFPRARRRRSRTLRSSAPAQTPRCCTTSTTTATLRDGDLLLVDAGAEYKGYASDITRTFPINGRSRKLSARFTTWCWKRRCPASRWCGRASPDDLKTHSIEMLTEGMVELGC